MFTPFNSSSEDWFSGEVRIRFRPVMGMHYVNKSTHRNDSVNTHPSSSDFSQNVTHSH